MIITIDGNIGCGKSTLLEMLKPLYSVDLEPVAQWEPFLKDMYQYGKDAFEFQVKVWSDRCFRPYYPKNKITCVERSPHYQWHVFSVVNHMNQKLNDRQMEVLSGLYQQPCYRPDLTIYLRSDPIKCLHRIQHRHRASESQISLDYICELHELHEIAYAGLLHPHKVAIDIEHKSVQAIFNEVTQVISKYVREHESSNKEYL